MRQKLSKLLLTGIITGALSFGPAVASQGAQESVTLYLKSLSMDRLTIDFTQNSQNLTIVGVIKSAVPLKSEDFNCGADGETPKTRTITISPLGDNFYRVACALTFGKATAPILGLSEAGLEVSDDNSNLNWQMFPLNSSLTIPQTAKDNFGIVRTKKIPLYRYPGTSTGFSAPIAISPPSDYKVPSFSSGPDGFLIFDVTDAPAAKPQIVFSKNKKTMSLKCPLPTTKVSSQVKKQVQVTFWINNKLVNPQQYLGNWFDPSMYNSVAIEKSLKGKSAKIFCATKYVIPESNVVLGYAESTEANVQFPK